MPWTARMLIDLQSQTPQTVEFGSGDTPSDAVKDMLLRVLRDWKRGTAECCGAYLEEIARCVLAMESAESFSGSAHPIPDFECQEDCYPEPWRIVVTQVPVDDTKIGDLFDLQKELDEITSEAAEELAKEIDMAVHAAPAELIHEALERAEEHSRELTNTLAAQLQTIRDIRQRPTEPAKPAHAVKPGGMVFTDSWSPHWGNPQQPLDEIRALRGALLQLVTQIETAPDGNAPYPELDAPLENARNVLKRFPER